MWAVLLAEEKQGMERSMNCRRHYWGLHIMLYIIVFISCQENTKIQKNGKKKVWKNGELTAQKKVVVMVSISKGQQSMALVFNLLPHQEGAHMIRVT